MNPWFRQFRPVTRPAKRLICFPHAGGAPSAYRSWPVLLPGDVEVLGVCYPGRQDRFSEPCFTDMHELADAVTQALLRMTDIPFVLFGHSMGGSLAHEVTIRLAAAGRRPEALLVSGCPAPHRLGKENTYLGGDEAIIDDVRKLNGDASADALADPDLRELLMLALRADYEIVGTYKPSENVQVGVPVVAYTGDTDPDVSAEDAAAWETVTEAGFRYRVFPGDHFYLEPCERDLLADVKRVLAGGPAA
jgi:surfactin synthase thioesterase subunit